MHPIDSARFRFRKWLMKVPERDTTDEFPVAVDALIGRHTYEAPLVHFYRGDTAQVRIGSFCSIALDVEFLPGGNHNPALVTSFPLRIKLGLGYDDRPEAVISKRDIEVGNDVWIGRGAKILGGVHIADGAVIGAYAVVSKDVAPYWFVAGNPAVPKSRRFADEICEALLEIAWWDWPDEIILERIDDLLSLDLEGFVAKYR